jgi:hypothetical protein
MQAHKTKERKEINVGNTRIFIHIVWVCSKGKEGWRQILSDNNIK